MSSKGNPLQLVFVRTSSKDDTHSDALCWVLGSEDVVRTGVEMLGEKFGDDDQFKPTFLLQDAYSLDVKDVHWVCLSFQEMNDKVSRQLDPWVTWRNACKAIWHDGCFFRADTLHRLRKSAKAKTSRSSGENNLIAKLLSGDDRPRLGGVELAKLRAYLAAPPPLSAVQADPSENERRRKLKTILHYNENLLVDEHQKTAPTTCADVEVLQDFATGIESLTAAIDMLHDEGEGPHDRTLHNPRELVIRSAGTLQKQVGGLRDTLSRQKILTGERKDTLANLSQSLDFIASVLRSSLANGWGYRITEEAVQQEVVKEWNGHWRNIRRSATTMQHWTEGMAEDQERELKPQPTAGTPKIGTGGVAWRDAMELAEKHVKAHNGAFSSIARIAKAVECSRPTIEKAICNSVYLKARRAEKQRKQPARTVALSEAAIEEVSEKRHDALTELVAEQQAEQAREERQRQAAKLRQP